MIGGYYDYAGFRWKLLKFGIVVFPVIVACIAKI